MSRDAWQPVSDTPEEATVSELAALSGSEALGRFFRRRHELFRAPFVWTLCEASSASLRSDLERAKRLGAAARWLAEELGDEPALARSLRAQANELTYGRDYEASVDLYEESIALFDRLGDEHEAAISRYSSTGALITLGRYERALELADAARRTLEKLNDRARLARLELNVGVLHSRRDRFAEALGHFQATLGHFREVGKPLDVATALRNIAVCHQDLNDFEASYRAYGEAAAYCAEHGLDLVGLEVEYNIAYLFYLRGDYGRAIHLFEVARRNCEKHGDAHHRALCDLDLAQIFLELNLVEDAAHLAGSAFEGFSALGMAYDTAKALTYQALAANLGGDPDRALELLDRSGESFARQGNRVWVAMAELYKALILLSADRPDDAGALAASAHETFVRSKLPLRTVVAEILRARVAFHRGDAEATKRWCRAAIEKLGVAGRPALAFEAHLVWGNAEEWDGDLAAALEEYRRADKAIESMRGQLGTDELKIAFSRDKRAVYEGLVGVTLKRGDSSAEAAAVFEYVEKAKSRGLADLLGSASRSPRPSRPGSEPLIEEGERQRQEINWLYRQMDEEELKGPEGSLERLEDLQRQCRRLEAGLLRTQRRLQAAEPEFSSLQGSAITDFETLRSALPEGGLLLEYFVSRGRVHAVVVGRDRAEVHTLARDSELLKLMQPLKFDLSAQRHRMLRGKNHLEHSVKLATRTLQKLYDMLVRPLSLAGAEHLLLVPDGLLHHLPLHALHDGERYLLDDLPVSYAPSATVYCLGRGRETVWEERSLVLGVPDANAPRILDEVRAVADILPNSRLLVGAEATRESLEAHGEGCRFVHIATHGLYRRDNPMFSALKLGDARLSLLDLYDLSLSAELAVVSGCATGRGKVQGADELVGLTRGLLFAGARTVLATLWDVDDESTARFMRLFYSKMVAGKRPARALRRAALELREDHPHPYHWAPFLLVGQV